MNETTFALATAACLCGGVFASCVMRMRLQRQARLQRREASFGRKAAKAAREAQTRDDWGFGLRYAETLTRRLYASATTPLSPSVRSGKARLTRAGAWYKANAKASGCSKRVSTAAYCEARTRMGLAGGLAGALLGAVLSAELAVALGLVGALCAGSMPRRSVTAARRRRTVHAQRHLSEMLEVVALGLRSGLTFDRSFALYGSHFDNPFARSCGRAYRSWALGLVTREEALRDLASSYDCEQLGRIVDGVVRGLRFGTALTGLLEEAAAQSRADYRTALEERVAKAPVKMMLPTGTLILPAMLLLVLGPILLELAGGF